MRDGAKPWLTLLVVAGVLSTPVPTEAQGIGATVSGRVTESATGGPVPGAFVTVEGTVLIEETDSLGRYTLTPVPPGPQVIRVQRIGFATARLAVTIPLRGAVTRDIELSAKALEMDDITVTVDAVSRAQGELGTASVIDLEAIRHQTATSLAGVLELLPGVEIQPPGLGNIQQFALRSAPTSGRSANAIGAGGILAGDLASFGTVIILDGVPISNNANLQTLGPRGEASFTSSAGGGIDLRRIPANTIERVEVIRGLPSARWGDLTQGAVIVDTRAGEVAPELAGQFDANTSEGSFVGGTSFGGPGNNGTLTYDIARSERFPGIGQDAAVRMAGQLSHRLTFGRFAGHEAVDPAPGQPRGIRGRTGRSALGTEKLTLDTRVDFFRLTEDLPENANIRIGQSSRKRDWGTRISERARLRLGETSRLGFTGTFSAETQNSRVTAEKLRGPIPFTDRLTEGRQEGFFSLAPYIAEFELDDGPRLAWARIELDTRPDLFGLDQRLRLGLEPRREWNGGGGLAFDVDKPLQISFTGVQGFDRPRNFDEIGALVTSGFYVDDRLTVPLRGRGALQIQGGLRLDLLHKGSQWFDGVRDAFLQPRINAEFSPVPNLRFRGGWGRVAKAPTLSQLFPAPQYYDVVNVNQFTNDPAERLAVITTSIQDPTNSGLGWIRATKAEGGVEFGLGGAEISVVAFRDRIDGGVAFNPQPSFLLREQFALTDSIIGNGIKPGVILPAIGADTVPILIDRPTNVVDQVNRGLELVASLPEISAIRTRLFVTGQLVETRQQTAALEFGSRLEFENFQLLGTRERAPFWDPVEEFGRRALLTYRLIHHQPALGLVITATVQHNITDKIRDIGAVDTLAFAGFITRAGELVRVPASERGKPEFEDLRVPRSGSLVRQQATPADWLASIRVSKTLPLDGQLNFWAFNITDRRGIRNELNVRPRIFQAIRFGLEVLLPFKSILPGRGG